MRFASRGPMRGGRRVEEKSSHVWIPDRQSRSSVRYPTPSMWTKVSRIIRGARAGSPPHIRSGGRGERARKPKSERPHGPHVIEFQKSIGTDLGTMLDVFSEPSHDRDRAFADIDETIHRAKEADSLRGDMALVGAVQGGLHPDLRERCAREVSSLGVSVCAIG